MKNLLAIFFIFFASSCFAAVESVPPVTVWNSTHHPGYYYPDASTACNANIVAYNSANPGFTASLLSIVPNGVNFDCNGQVLTSSGSVLPAAFDTIYTSKNCAPAASYEAPFTMNHATNMCERIACTPPQYSTPYGTCAIPFCPIGVSFSAACSSSSVNPSTGCVGKRSVFLPTDLGGPVGSPIPAGTVCTTDPVTHVQSCQTTCSFDNTGAYSSVVPPAGTGSGGASGVPSTGTGSGGASGVPSTGTGSGGASGVPSTGTGSGGASGVPSTGTGSGGASGVPSTGTGSGGASGVPSTGTGSGAGAVVSGGSTTTENLLNDIKTALGFGQSFDLGASANAAAAKASSDSQISLQQLGADSVSQESVDENTISGTMTSFFQITPLHSVCHPIVGVVMGKTVSWDFCPYTEMLRNVLSYLMSLFTIYFVYTTFFRK